MGQGRHWRDTAKKAFNTFLLPSSFKDSTELGPQHGSLTLLSPLLSPQENVTSSFSLKHQPCDSLTEHSKLQTQPGHHPEGATPKPRRHWDAFLRISLHSLATYSLDNRNSLSSTGAHGFCKPHGFLFVLIFEIAAAASCHLSSTHLETLPPFYKTGSMKKIRQVNLKSIVCPTHTHKLLCSHNHNYLLEN